MRFVARYSSPKWLAEHHGFDVRPVPDQPQHCPSHGGKSGAAFRFYANMARTGGGICNSCDNLRSGNGIDLLLGWLVGTRRAAELRAAFITLSGWIEAFAAARADIPPHPSPQIARRLREWVMRGDGVTVAAHCLRKLPGRMNSSSTLCVSDQSARSVVSGIFRTFESAVGLIRSHPATVGARAADRASRLSPIVPRIACARDRNGRGS
ncbi:primase-helicase zinc-binding domain-containing protein [Sinimarinibacterium thermocellulolyticum]|uniref:Primase-helicase zinc-binding domain-containing protein n=1 Tax=Sinimarinibacterium thermocellulolyticum TaxID=3170016 RepID=A0ABV2A7N2_9GAMM